MSLIIKICGLKTPETLEAAIAAGADWVGFVFFAKSPRNVLLDEAKVLGQIVGSRAKKVALSVDADDAALADIEKALTPDLHQLHGHEAPERVAAIRARFGRPVIKAVGIAEAADLEAARAYETAADWLLLDAKPPKNAALPGGNGLPFDWQLLAGLDLQKPFMVSGGLDPSNVGEAIAISHPAGVDVSSGVEAAPGIKDPAKIRAFIEAARRAR
ncbi:MAG: phosphoribosylanthranilate isomerase [Alphaproteobacteria bacterium]|nr:phosphoribosylanthranilate isomerase [Alphaproteobacteria bacterium]